MRENDASTTGGRPGSEDGCSGHPHCQVGCLAAVVGLLAGLEPRSRRCLRVQVAHDCHDATVVLIGVERKIEFHEDAGNVLFYGARRDHEGLGYGRVRSALGHECEHFRLPRGEPPERVGFAAAGEELAHDLRVECGAAVCHPLECLDEFPDVGYPVLQRLRACIPTVTAALLALACLATLVMASAAT